MGRARCAYASLFASANYLAAVQTTTIFSVGVTVLTLVISLAFAAAVDRLMRAGGIYTAMMIWPYAIAPAIAGVLWWFMFDPSIGILAYWLRVSGIPWNNLLDGTDALILVIVAAAWRQISYNFIFFLAGLQSIPISRTSTAALFVILFIYGWNQYLWPLLVTTDPNYYTIVMGIQRAARATDQEPLWNAVMAVAVLALLPPVIVVIAMQKLFVRGLVETEK